MLLILYELVTYQKVLSPWLWGGYCQLFRYMPGPPCHDIDSVRQKNRFINIMSDKEGGQPDAFHYLKVPLMQAALGYGVQSTERFIQKGNLVGKQIGSKKGSSLPHASRKLFGIFKLGSLQSELLKKGGSLLPCRFLLPALYDKRQCNIINDGLKRKEHILLQHIAQLSCPACNVLSVHGYGTGIRHQQAGEHIKKSRFTHTADPKEAYDFSLVKLQGYILQYFIVSVAHADIICR